MTGKDSPVRTAYESGGQGKRLNKGRKRDGNRRRGGAPGHEMHGLTDEASGMRMRRVVVIAVVVMMVARAVFQRASIIIVRFVGCEDDQRRNVRHGGGVQRDGQQHLQPDGHEA